MINLQEYNNNKKLIRSTEVADFGEALKICNKSELDIFEMHVIFNGEVRSFLGAKQPNNYIDWVEIKD
ncbi:MAG: hypothetical protein ACFFG0_04170 [Candidatus Thorarchaeota archaeon]